ncbi:MAG TPA: flagellar filament capping protein FliD [Candidatus Aquicultor sp.]|jgi:flagellar hook-associated protein 2
MSSVTTSGIFSNINTDDIVSKLMQVERQPLVNLQKKEADYQAKITGLGSLLSSISTLKGSMTALKDSNIVGMKAVSSNTNILAGVATTGASAAHHTIKVTNTATVQSIYSAAFTNTTDQVADLSLNNTQKMQIQVGSGAVFTITVDATNNSLKGLRDAINGAKAGVGASIVNDGTGNRLFITSNTTGASNKITIKVDENNNGIYEEAPTETDATGLSRLAFNATYDVNGAVIGGITNMTQSLAAKDALLIVDGLTITKSSNSFTDVIEGVTIALKDDSAGGTVNLDIVKDTDAIKSKINAFVTAYNAAMSTLKSLEGTKDAKGSIGTDSTLRSLKNTLRDMVTNNYSNSSLAVLGVTHDKTGVLSFDSATFDKALVGNEQNVVATINAAATALESTLSTYEKQVVPDKQKAYDATAKLLAKKEESLTLRLDKMEADLKKKYNNLDKVMQQLQGQSTYLTQQAAANYNSSK